MGFKRNPRAGLEEVIRLAAHSWEVGAPTRSRSALLLPQRDVCLAETGIPLHKLLVEKS